MPEPATDDLGVPPAGVTPIVAADIASDEAGEPRSKEQSPPPPGTTVPTFWQSPATRTAIGTTLGPLIMVAATLIGGDALDRKALGAAFGVVAWAWAAAFGVFRTDANALRWK